MSGELPDELFTATPAEFVSVRDALAKRLRADGEKDAADRVKRARKPTVSVWALNRLARERPDQLAAVLSAGDTLRRAQEELQADQLRSGTTLLRKAIAGTVEEAVAVAREVEVTVPVAQRERMADTLFAVATGEGEERDRLRQGRLLEDLESIGFVGAAPRPGAVPRADPKADARRRLAEAEVEAKEATDRARRARAAADELRRQAEEARLRAADLEDEAKRLADAAASAEADVERANAAVEEARAGLET